MPGKRRELRRQQRAGGTAADDEDVDRFGKARRPFLGAGRGGEDVGVAGLCSRSDRTALSSSHHLSPIMTHTAPRRHLRSHRSSSLAIDQEIYIWCHRIEMSPQERTCSDLDPSAQNGSRSACLADERAPAVLERGDRHSCRDGGGDLVIVPTRLRQASSPGSRTCRARRGHPCGLSSARTARRRSALRPASPRRQSPVQPATLLAART